MSADRDPLDALLQSISDGAPTDWSAAERDVGIGARHRLASLRDVARIAEFNRGLQRDPADARAPERWGDLLLLECLGAGARGEVYRAWDPGLRREVALKLMRPNGDDAALIEEGRHLARIRHRHVVSVLGIDRRDGRVGLWMERIRGWTLEQAVRAQGPLDPDAVTALGVDLGSALAAVHAARLLHRDIKPANVMRDDEGRWVLADFGLGVRLDVLGLGAASPSGTPMFMAPEILSGGVASERSDLYSLGLLLWFSLTGRQPFEAQTLAELEVAAAQGPRPGLGERRSDLPPALTGAIERAITPDPGRRFTSASALVEALEACRRRPAPSPRRALVAVATLVVVVAAAALLVRWPQRNGEAPVVAPPAISPSTTPYAVEASFLRRDERHSVRLASGDRVKPGDRLALEVRATRPVWLYVLNEDERGQRFLLFPQPRFDMANPVIADSTQVLPGTVGGQEHAWTVTSAGGREHLLIVASPTPVSEIEADLGRWPGAKPDRPIDYTPVGDAAIERLRGMGGLTPLPSGSSATRSSAFERFRALAGHETGIEGVWVRQVVFENTGR